MGFILRQGWAALDRGLPLRRRAGQRGEPSTFPARRWSGEPRRIAQLRRLWESRFDRLPFDFAQALSPSKGIELEIIRVIEAGHALKESPDYELHLLTRQTPAFFDETVRRHVASLEKEVGLLESEAEQLAKEIEELTSELAAELGRC